MKASQKEPQLSALVFLNHDLVTDCKCVHKGMCLDRLVEEAVKMATSPSHLLTQHTFIALCHLQASSVSAGVSDLRAWQTHVTTNTHTHTLSLSLSVSSGVCVHTSASETESLIGMNSCKFGVYFVLVPIFFRFTKVILTLYVSCNGQIFSQFDFCGYCC